MFQPFSYYSQYSYIDLSALTFISASGITDYTQKTAINQLTIDLKSYGIWNKMKAVYPFVGGSAATHKWNLINPVDTNAGFRLNFFGSVTHNSNGITGNGLNAYALTYVAPTPNLTLDSTSVSLYSRSDTNTTAVDIGMGFDNGADPRRLSVSIRYSNVYYGDQYNYNTGRATAANSTSLGLYTDSRTSSAVHKAYKNNTQLGTTNTGVSGPISALTGSIALLAMYRQDTSAGLYFSDKNIAFAHIGDGLTDVDVVNLYSTVQKYQTILNRQV
jgi:hypothetical protein